MAPLDEVGTGPMLVRSVKVVLEWTWLGRDYVVQVTVVAMGLTFGRLSRFVVGSLPNRVATRWARLFSLSLVAWICPVRWMVLVWVMLTESLLVWVCYVVTLSTWLAPRAFWVLTFRLMICSSVTRVPTVVACLPATRLWEVTRTCRVVWVFLLACGRCSRARLSGRVVRVTW